MKIYGHVLGKDGKAIGGASVEIKNASFDTVYRTLSAEDGYYEMEADDEVYPFLTAVKAYADKYLEYWCQNIDLTRELTLDPVFDRLEIYGLDIFRVKGGYPSLMIYFRPMSLDKFLRGEEELAPDLCEIRVRIDGRDTGIYSESAVSEFLGDRRVRAYLLQTELPPAAEGTHRLSVEITDHDGNYGKAELFYR